LSSKAETPYKKVKEKKFEMKTIADFLNLRKEKYPAQLKIYFQHPAPQSWYE